MSLQKHTGHLVEGCGWSTSKPTAPGWYWWRAESFYIGVRCVEIMKNSPQVLSAGLQTQDLRVSGDDAFLKGLPLDGIPGEWCPIPLPTDAPAQGWYKAEEMDELLGEVESTLGTLVNLAPDIGKLTKVKWILDQLRGGA